MLFQLLRGHEGPFLTCLCVTGYLLLGLPGLASLDTGLEWPWLSNTRSVLSEDMEVHALFSFP